MLEWLGSNKCLLGINNDQIPIFTLLLTIYLALLTTEKRKKSRVALGNASLK